MDGRGGCCIARYPGGSGGTGGCVDTSKIDRIMLRFRPIAPKPIVGGSGNREVNGNNGGGSSPKLGNKPVKSGRGRKRCPAPSPAAKSSVKSSGINSSGSSTGNGGKRSNCGRKRKLPPQGVQQAATGACGSGSSNSGGERSPRSASTSRLPSDAIVQGNYYINPNLNPSVVTLPLLPESPDLTVKSKKQKIINNKSFPMRLNFDHNNPTQTAVPPPPPAPTQMMTPLSPANKQMVCGSLSSPAPPAPAVPVSTFPPPLVESVVTVECITDTWMEDGNLQLGATDEEKRVKLSKDTCPAFISDRWNRVLWTNESYRKMTMGSSSSANAQGNCRHDDHHHDQGARNKSGQLDGSAGSGGTRVLVVIGEKAMVPASPLNCRGFTCKVKVQYSSRGITCDAVGDQKKSAWMSSTLPCDVWKLRNGDGFAWRLDVKAALSLSL